MREAKKAYCQSFGGLGAALYSGWQGNAKRHLIAGFPWPLAFEANNAAAYIWPGYFMRGERQGTAN
jgi:hypothetical protein